MYAVPRFLGRLSNLYSSLALTALALLLGLLLGYSSAPRAYEALEEEVIRGPGSDGFERFAFLAVRKPSGPPDFELKAMDVILVAGFRGDEIVPVMEQRCSSNPAWEVSVELRDLQGGVRGREETLIPDGGSLAWPRISLPETGLYLIIVNRTQVKPVSAFECTVSLRVSFSEASRGLDPALRVSAVAIALAPLLAALLVTASRGGWGVGGWVAGLTFGPLASFIASLLYVYLVRPYKARLGTDPILEVTGEFSPSNPSVRFLVYGMLDTLSPLSSPTYVATLLFIAMGASLLAWSTVETRTELYEALSTASKRRLFLLKVLMPLALVSLAPTLAQAISIASTYPGFYYSYPVDTMILFLSGFAGLVVLVGLVQSASCLLVLLTGRGLLVAIVIGVGIVLASSYTVLPGLSILDMATTSLGNIVVTYGEVSSRNLRIALQLGALSLLLYALSYLAYSRREVH